MTARNLRAVAGVLIAALVGMPAAPARADEGAAAPAEVLHEASEAQIGFSKGSIIVAPIPLKNPVLGNGVIGVGGYLFRFDEGSDTSFIGAAGLKTDNGSLGAGIAANLSFGQGRWTVLTMAGRARLNYSISGIGDLHFDPLRLSQDGTFARLAVSRSIGKTWSLGVDTQYLDTTIRPNGDGTIPLPNLPGFGVGVQQVLLGPRLTYDSRDDTVYPTRGGYASLVIQRGVGLGGFDNRFTRGTLETKAYFPIGSRGVLAVAGTACQASASAPFFNMCTVGLSDGLRGYSAGQYIDDALASVQAEFRYRLGGRWGVAAFAGTSSIGSDFSDLGKQVHAGGVGLRFRLSKSFPLDFSVDRTLNGEGDSFTYVYIGQAF